MEAIEREVERQKRRISKENFAPPTVQSINDIKRILSEFSPSNRIDKPESNVGGLVEATVDGKKRVFNVKAETKSKTKRDILLEGMTVIKERAESDKNHAPSTVTINGKEIQPLKVGNDIQSYFNIDPLIERWFNAKRDGLTIYWELEDGRYNYDPFKHRLTKQAKS